MTLNLLPVGCRGRISGLAAKGGMRRRLSDLGFLRGAEVECVLRKSSGQTAAFFVRGTVIALRSEDSSGVTLE